MPFSVPLGRIYPKNFCLKHLLRTEDKYVVAGMEPLVTEVLYLGLIFSISLASRILPLSFESDYFHLHLTVSSVTDTFILALVFR